MSETAKSDLKEKGFGSYFPIILALCVILGLPSAMLINTASIFYPVISEDWGVATAAVSAWMSLCLLSCALFSPIIGRWMEKYDIRVLMVISILVEVCAFLIFSVVTEPWMLWVVGFICGIPNTILMGMSSSVLINRSFLRWYRRHHLYLVLPIYPTYASWRFDLRPLYCRCSRTFTNAHSSCIWRRKELPSILWTRWLLYPAWRFCGKLGMAYSC